MNENKLNIVPGEFVTITTQNSIVAGELAAYYTYTTKTKEEKAYRICIGDKMVDIYEHEIVNICRTTLLDKEKFLKEEIDKKHGVKCFDKNNKLLSNSTILASFLDGDKWDELTESEKAEFVKHMDFNEDDVIEIINVLFDFKYENQKLHDKRQEALENGCNALKKYEEIRCSIPEGAVYYDFVYKQLGIEKLIKSL